MQRQSVIPLPARPAPAARWRLRLLGHLEARHDLNPAPRWPSQAAALLLARLAMAPQRAHPREELVELLWPGVEAAVGRNRLRQTLSVLRTFLEPSPAAARVLVADRLHLRVLPEAIDCDVPRFEALVRGGDAAAARELYGGELMPGVHLEWVVEERQRLATLAERLDAPATRPAAALPSIVPSLAAPPPLLPSYLTRLFGGEAVVAALAAQVRRQRLVTLLGPGGSGKTRLAVELAHRLRAEAAFDCVAFVSAVACEHAGELRAAIADALSLPPAAAARAATLAPAFGSRSLLLVLDNCEQIAEPAGALAVELLARAPRLHLLATSRRPLGSNGEQEFALAPLDPAGAALALFEDRASAVRAGFRLDAAENVAAKALMHALEGLPLAVELAASRMRSLSPAQVLAAIGRGGAGAGAALDLLARPGTRAGLDPRHASMRRTIAWSWSLLSAEQAALASALTLFAGSFTAGHAAALHGADCRIALDDLAAHSLLRVLPSAGTDAEPRLALYEPVREFAAEQFEATHDASARSALRARLRQGWLAWAQALPRRAPQSLVEPERGNLRAAVAGALADGAPAEGLAIVLALRTRWDSDGAAAAEVETIEAALADLQAREPAPDEATRSLIADTHELLAYLRFGSGDTQAADRHAAAGLEAAGAAPGPRARALLRQAWLVLVALHWPQAPVAALAEALALAREAGDRETEARVLHQQAIVAAEGDRDFDRALQLLQRAEAIWLDAGDMAKARATRRAQAGLLMLRGQHADAITAFRANEAESRAAGDWVGCFDALLRRGRSHLARREWQAALAALLDCARICDDRRHRHGLAYALWHLPRALLHCGRAEDAARLAAYAESHWVRHVAPLSALSRADADRLQRLLRRVLGPARAAELHAAGLALNEPAALALIGV